MDVGIAVTSKNKGKYLERCLDSLAGQTRRPNHVVLLNDGSTDTTSLFASHPVVSHYFESPGTGSPGAAKNLAVRHVRADAVWIVDGDDELPPDAVETLERALFQNPELSYVWGAYLDFDLGVSQPREYRPRDRVRPCAMLCRVDAFWRMGGYLEGIPFSEDHALAMKLQQYERGLYVDHIVYHYIRTNGSQTRPMKPGFRQWNRVVAEHLKNFTPS